MSKPNTKRIDSPAQLISLSNDKKCVWVERWKRKSPAAFFMSWHFRIVMDWIGAGRIEMIVEDEQA